MSDGMMGEGVVPSEGIGSAGSAGMSGNLSYLNADWVNERVANVRRKVDYLLDRLIDNGLLATGYPPFEQPITDEMLSKMAPEQFRSLFDSLQSVGQKSELLARMKALKLPPVEMMPFPEKARYPVPKPVAGEEHSTVDSRAVV